jgi:hypothetical protein
MKNFLTRLSFVIMYVVLFACGNSDPEPSAPNDPKACFAEVASVVAGTAIQFNSDCSVNASTFLWDFGGKGTS